MPGRHRPGYQAAYQRARKRTVLTLKAAHSDEWQEHFDRYLAEELAKIDNQGRCRCG